MLNIGDTGHTAPVQPACDVSNRELLLTLVNPFRLSSVQRGLTIASSSNPWLRFVYCKKLFFVTKTTQEFPSPLSRLPAESPASKQIQGFRAIP